MHIKCPRCHADNPPGTKSCDHCGLLLDAADKMPAAQTKTLETSKKELTTGSTFAERYQIIEELGKGGMGRVYKAQDTEVNEKVALKLIKPEIAADKKTIERFRNELKLARKVRHKNVCQMYDLNKEEGSYYITMEFVSGQDLKKLIRQTGSLTVSTAVSIARQVCEGLSEAHKLGVVHRDLKSNNIMIDEDGSARIMDFGIARSLKAKSITGSGVMIGTPEYMSPEQVEGKEVDQRSDIYSLGIILYEMVTGQVPFEGDTPFTIGVKHKSEVPKNPKDLNTNLPDDLSRVILRCLEKNRESRYQSADELRSELINIEKGIPTTERKAVKTKSLTSKELTVTLNVRKLFLPAVIVLALVIAAVAIWQFLPRKKPAPLAPEGKPYLAVMHFKNNTGDENLTHLRTMLSDLLITDLSQSKHLKVLSGEKVYEILRDLNKLEVETYSTDVLQEVAVQGGVSHVLLGNYARMGDVFRIDVIIQRIGTGEIIGSERVEARGEEDVFPKIDELTTQIKTAFKLTEEEIASDLDKDIGQITTSSSEAYKYYIEGTKHLGSDNRRSLSLFEKAVEIDPEFAIAYQKMSIAYWTLGLISERKKYVQKALGLTDRISDKERLMIQGHFFQESERTYDKAIEAYARLLELYPAGEGNIGLGILYRDIEEWDKAIEVYEVLVKSKSPAIASYRGLARAYMAKGLYDKAKEALEKYISNFSDHPEIRRWLAQNYLEHGKFDLALAEIDKAFFLDPTNYENIRIKGDILVLKGEFKRAEEEYQKLLALQDDSAFKWRGILHLARFYMLLGTFEAAKDLCEQALDMTEAMNEYRWKSDFHRFLASINRRLGNFEPALKECDLAWDSAGIIDNLDRQRRALYRKGIVYIKMGSMEEAQQTAEELKDLIEKGMNKKSIRRHHHLMGMMEFEKGNYSKAIEYFTDAVALLSGGPLAKRADFIYSLAEAHYKTKNLEAARQEYARITTLTTGREYHGSLYAKACYMLGKIDEQQDNTSKAIENYEKFLELWKDADPIFPEIEDAKTRLAALKN